MFPSGEALRVLFALWRAAALDYGLSRRAPPAAPPPPPPARPLPRALARSRRWTTSSRPRAGLPRPIFGYIAGAAEDNQSLRASRDAFARYGFVPRVLVNVSARSQQFDLFGRRYAPFGIAPMGLSALSAYRGDIVQARAARASNIPAILSGTSLIPLEDVIQAAPGTWFQAYLPGDPARIDALVERARKAGYETLVLTVDIPVSANRETMCVPASPAAQAQPAAGLELTRPRWLAGTFLRTLLAHGMPHFENSFATRGAPSCRPPCCAISRRATT